MVHPLAYAKESVQCESRFSAHVYAAKHPGALPQAENNAAPSVLIHMFREHVRAVQRSTSAGEPG